MSDWVAAVSYNTGIEATPDEVGTMVDSSTVEVEFRLDCLIDDLDMLRDVLLNGPDPQCIEGISIRRSDPTGNPTVSMIDLHARYTNGS